MSRPERAQFFTPPAVAEFVWQAVRLLAGRTLGRGWRMIDPAAGRGAFLEVVLAPGRLFPDRVYGIELDPDLAGQLKEQVRQARFLVGDGLLQDFPGVEPDSFDVVLGNPPFGRLGQVTPSGLVEQWEKDARWQERFAVWQVGQTQARRGSGPARSLGVELLFVERSLQLAREGGMVALVLPEGFVANDRLQAVRDWVLEQAVVLGVVGLPAAAFRRAGLNARTAVVFLRKKGRGRREEGGVFLAGGEEVSAPLEAYLERTLEEWHRHRQDRPPCGRRALFLPADRLRGQRWDAGYWRGQAASLNVDRRFPLVPLGDFIAHLTYGPIVTGQKPCPAEQGIRVVRQGDFAETGLCLAQALRVPAGSVYDPERSRVRQGDLLLPRSGWGSLGRNRVAVYLEEEPANVGCFVDLIRLERLNPFYVWFFLKTRPGWQQVRSLINGVGAPNINFAQIRSLRIPRISSRAQQTLEQRYYQEVWPLHCRGEESPSLRREGESRFRLIAVDLERYLEGRSRFLRPPVRVVGS